MAAAGAEDISIERLLGRDIIPPFRSISSVVHDDRTLEEKMEEIAEVKAVFAKEYAEAWDPYDYEREYGVPDRIKRPDLTPQQQDELELFAEAGVVSPERLRKLKADTSEERKEELEEMKQEFKEHY